MHPCLGAPHFSFRTFVKECLSYFLHPMITILGPTACGKTSLAVALAAHLDAEIISGDSRQVYRGMDILQKMGVRDIDRFTYIIRNH